MFINRVLSNRPGSEILTKETIKSSLLRNFLACALYLVPEKTETSVSYRTDDYDGP